MKICVAVGASGIDALFDQPDRGIRKRMVML